jgi:AmmeMemoRadiSam system protein B
MGRIPIHITLFGVSADSESDHLSAARAEVERLASILDLSDLDGAVARLNRTAGADGIDPGPEVRGLLKTSLWLHEVSGGAFDPTIGPVAAIWERGGEAAPPGEEELGVALGKVDATRVRIDDEHGKVRFEQAGMEINLGALNRGFLVDRIVDLLRGRGVESGVVRSGRAIRVFSEAESEPQTVDLQDPRSESVDPVGSVWLRDGAVAVAGIFQVDTEGDPDRSGLIFDPRTGRPVEAVLSATVRAPEAVRAAGLATAMVVLGPAAGMKLIESIPDVEGLVLYQDAGGLRRWVSAGLDEVQWMRPSALAGSWYEADPEILRKDLNRYLERAERTLPDGKPVALIAPHAGYRYSGQAAAYGYRALRGRSFDRVVVLGVSHRAPFSGASLPPASHYDTPLGRIRIDDGARRRLLANPLFHTVPTAHEREHSIEIQLPFLQEVLGDFLLVPVLFGQMPPEDFPRAAAAIREIWDEKTLLVASTDFTHFGARFGYQPFREMILGNLRKLDAGGPRAGRGAVARPAAPGDAGNPAELLHFGGAEPGL